MGPPDHWAFRGTHPTHPTSRVTHPPAGRASGPHLPAQIPQEASEVQSTRPHPETLTLGTSGTKPCFPSDGVPPAQSGASLQISSEQGKPLPTDGKLFHPMTGLCLPQDWTPQGLGCVLLLGGSHHALPPTDRPPPKTRLCSPLRLVTTGPSDEPHRQCFELFLWTKCP